MTSDGARSSYPPPTGRIDACNAGGARTDMEGKQRPRRSEMSRARVAPDDAARSGLTADAATSLLLHRRVRRTTRRTTIMTSARARALTAILAALFASALFGGTQPASAHVAGRLQSVACPTSTTCYAVGAFGAILKEDGTGWKSESSGASSLLR